MTTPPRQESELLLYTAPGGVVKVSVLFQDDTAWLTQKALAELWLSTRFSGWILA